MKFTEMLRARWRNADTLLCVGLDPDLARLPEELAGKPDAIYSFCTGIVDATADLVCAFKPQIAYFASEGAEDALNRVVAYIHSNHPGIPVILDAKRGDIGSTAKHYAEEAFDRYGADCVTLSPYMGGDTLDPYLAYAEKGAFVLCRTSNKGGDDLQMIDLGGGERLFERVARLSHMSGTVRASLASLLAQPTPMSLLRYAALRRTYRSLCPASAPREATLMLLSKPVWTRKGPVWSSIPAAQSYTPAAVPTGAKQPAVLRLPHATPSTAPANSNFWGCLTQRARSSTSRPPLWMTA